MNLSHGLSNWRLLVGRETSLVFGIRYSSPAASSFQPDGENFFRAGDFKFDSELCNCCVDVVWRFKLLFTLLGVVSRAIVLKTSLLWPSGRKWRSSSARYRADKLMLRWTLSSLIPLDIVKDYSRYPTEIPLLISYQPFWFSKLQKTKSSYALLTLLLLKCLRSGAKAFPNGWVNFEVWLSKLWILTDRQLEATVRLFLNVSSTRLFVCNS